MKPEFDVGFVGHYTKDTIVSPSGTRVVNGGAFNYGAHVAACMGLRVAAITRLASEDWHVVDRLAELGVRVFAQVAPRSTCLRIEYPGSNPDQRVLYVSSTAGPFSPEEVEHVAARAFVVGPSMRGEVGLEVLQALVRRGGKLALDVQGYVRVNRDGELVYAAWPERDQVLKHVDILKADSVEAEFLTGQSDVQRASQALAAFGPREIVLTHRDGLLVHADGQFFHAGFFPRAVVGRSGRGDTCLAAYVARRLTVPPAQATTWAAAVTSLKMEAEGPFRRDITDVEELLRQRYRA